MRRSTPLIPNIRATSKQWDSLGVTVLRGRTCGTISLHGKVTFISQCEVTRQTVQTSGIYW